MSKHAARPRTTLRAALRLIADLLAPVPGTPGKRAAR